MNVAIETKERPILFSGEMVRAILGGRKTQTRRIIKPQFKVSLGVNDGTLLTERITPQGRLQIKCPYGKPGDRLWVRETWAVGNIYDRVAPRNICLDIRSQEGRSPTKAPCKVAYPASGGCAGLKGRPSIHMPRWASRITLEITAVRVERLNDISKADAKAEGVRKVGFSDNAIYKQGDTESMVATGCWANYLDSDHPFLQPLESFGSLWESINGPGSWSANPWVWVVEFRRLEAVE